MRCRLVRGAVLALCLISAPMMVGCEVKTFQVQLPGYGNGEVDGIYLWKQVAGKWTRICRIDFTDRRITAQGETLSYVQNCIQGKTRRGVVFPARVHRMDGNPATISIDITYLRYEDPGTYRATAFNEAGESPLSATSLPL
jgi:hypothetical protein